LLKISAADPGAKIFEKVLVEDFFSELELKMGKKNVFLRLRIVFFRRFSLRAVKREVKLSRVRLMIFLGVSLGKSISCERSFFLKEADRG